MTRKQEEYEDIPGTFVFDALAENGKGMYRFYYMEFDRIWERCRGTPMKLSEAPRRRAG